MRVLLTGATGFIGSHTARALIERGHEVHALVREGAGLHRIADLVDRLTVVDADLHDEEAMGAAVAAVAPEGAIHAAWYVEPGRYLHAVPENLAALEASLRLLRLLTAVDCERVVVVGTSFEPRAGGPHGGVRPPQESIYASTKAALHDVVERLAAQGFRAACGHVFYLYGPHEDERRLIPALVAALLRGEEIDVTDGRQRRDYLHVADVASALCTMLERDASGSFDICSGTPTLMADAFRAVGEAVGRPELIKVGTRPYGEGEVLEAAGDDTPLRRLGWAPAVDLTQGIKTTVAWWEEHLGA